VRGLLVSGMPASAAALVDNLLQMLGEVGHVPNGARVYYLNRRWVDPVCGGEGGVEGSEQEARGGRGGRGGRHLWRRWVGRCITLTGGGLRGLCGWVGRWVGAL
jgi:hypothetical protein